MAGTTRQQHTAPTDAGVVRCVYLENRQPGHLKFYRVIVEADPTVAGRHRCRVEWGRIGRISPSTMVKHCGDLVACEREAESLLDKERGRGYVVVEAQVAGAPASVPVAQARSLTEALARRRRAAVWPM